MAQLHSMFLLIFLLATSTYANVNECHSSALNGCMCGKVYHDSTSLFTVNCTNLGFTSTDMLTNLPEQTQMLIFTGNHIAELPPNVFGDTVDLSSLRIIDMSNNGISDIKGKAFHHVSNVERLILNHNNISITYLEDRERNRHHPRVFSNFESLTELHLTNAFADNTGATLAENLHDIFVNSNLTKLYKLHLEQNEIRSFLDERVFCDLPNIHDIYLGDNNLPGLNFNVECLHRLRYLDLEQNNITELKTRDLEQLDRLAGQQFRVDKLVVEMRGNPFRCDAALRGLYGWLKRTNVEVRQKEELECHQPKYGHRYIVSLKGFAEAKHARLSQAITVLLVILSIVLVTLLAAYGYLKKDKMRAKFTPLFETLSRKVHYTTIESQEV